MRPVVYLDRDPVSQRGAAAVLHQTQAEHYAGGDDGMPMGLYTADAIVERTAGTQTHALRFRYHAQNLSLGRRDGLIQPRHADDTSGRAVLTGDAAAAVKETVVRSTIWGLPRPCMPDHVWSDRASRHDVAHPPTAL